MDTNEKTQRPIFRAEGHTTVSDMAKTFKPYYRERSPMWQRIIVSVSLLVIFVCYVKITDRGIGEYLLIGCIFALASLMMFFNEYLIGFLKLLERKGLNMNKNDVGKIELSDRLYFEHGTIRQSFELTDITGFYEFDDYFVIRLFKRAFASVNKSDFTEGTPEEFAAYLRSMTTTPKAPKVYKVLAVITSVIMVLLAAFLVFAASLVNFV